MKFYLPILAFFLILSCNRNTTPNTNEEVLKNYQSHTDYRPNPDQVVLELKLISSDKDSNGNYLVKASVIKQVKTGFSANVILNPEDEIMILATETPYADRFFCALDVMDSPDPRRKYRVTKYLK